MKRIATYAAIVIATIILTSMLRPLDHLQVLAQPGCQAFKETGQSVCGKFLAYWNAHGGLAQQGYPIGPELREVSELNGQEYTVQYFERAVFELHPENTPPNDVLLSQLGTYQARRRYGDPPTWQAAPAPIRQELKAGVNLTLLKRGDKLGGWTTGLDSCLGGAMAWVVNVENASNVPYTLLLDQGIYMVDSTGREYRNIKAAQCGGPTAGDALKGPLTIQAAQSTEFAVNLDATGLPSSATYLELRLSIAGTPFAFRYALR